VRVPDGELKARRRAGRQRDDGGMVDLQGVEQRGEGVGLVGDGRPRWQRRAG
jgi:hypothetical protein